jgi:hypothetical protein
MIEYICFGRPMIYIYFRTTLYFLKHPSRHFRLKLDIFPRTDKSTKCRGLVSENEWVSKTH